MSEWYDRKWILSRLPHDIPQDIVDHAFDGMGQYYVKKDPLEVWCIGEREADHVVERFANKEKMMTWVCENVCWHLSCLWELEGRADDERKWRYVRDHAENGQWYYREHKDYLYNAIHDSRKCSFETELKLLKPMISTEEWEKQVERKTRLMNRWFKKQHWAYDEMLYEFIEISDSKEYASDYDDTEEPREGSVISGNHMIRVSPPFDQSDLL